MRQNGLSIVILLVCVGLSGWRFGYAHAQEVNKPKPVKVATPQRGTIEREISYTGNLAADAMVEVYADAPGKLVVLNVDEGDRVNRGDVLAQTDTRELKLALKQAEASLKGAEAQLVTVRATARTKIEAQLKTAQASLDGAMAQLKQAEATAQVQVESQALGAAAGEMGAKAALDKAKSGARAQEIQQAKAAALGAKASLDNAQANFDRVKELHEKEAISDKDLDNAQAQLDGAKAQHDASVEQLSLVEEGARVEDIQAAQAQLTQAQASLGLARVKVESEDWKTQIELAKSKVRQAEANVLSAETLVGIKAWEHEIASAEAQFDLATAQVDLAKKRLNDAVITSPVTGIVVNRNADRGDYASSATGPGATPIFTVVKVDVVKAEFRVSEADLANVAVGTKVRIFAGGQRIDGEISFISPMVNPDDRTVKVKAEIPNPEYRLKPGMFAEVAIDRSTGGDSLLLPRHAVLDVRDGSGHVFTAADGVARQQRVTVGLAWGESISILEGVTDSTPVIVSGHRGLSDGMRIVVVE